MNLLLDTHTFLWYISGDRRLPSSWLTLLRDSSNTSYVSVASVWEAVIKHSLGKLPLPEAPGVYLPKQRERHGFSTLVIDEATVALLPTLPPLHRDPFDRILVCQALRFELVIATVDPSVRAYSVSCL